MWRRIVLVLSLTSVCVMWAQQKIEDDAPTSPAAKTEIQVPKNLRSIRVLRRERARYERASSALRTRTAAKVV